MLIVNQQIEVLHVPINNDERFFLWKKDGIIGFTDREKVKGE